MCAQRKTLGIYGRPASSWMGLLLWPQNLDVLWPRLGLLRCGLRAETHLGLRVEACACLSHYTGWAPGKVCASCSHLRLDLVSHALDISTVQAGPAVTSDCTGHEKNLPEQDLPQLTLAMTPAYSLLVSTLNSPWFPMRFGILDLPWSWT